MKEKQAINLLVKRLNRKNKLRNIIIIIAIVLTSVLLSVLFTVAFSTKQLLLRQSLKEIGTEAEGCYRGVTSSEYEVIEKSNKFDDISYDIFVGNAINQEFLGNIVETRYIEETAADWCFCKLTQGTFPQEVDEIVVDNIFLRYMGGEYSVGDSISLELQIDDAIRTMTFVISGIYEGNEVLGVSEIYVSKAFLDEVLYQIHSEEEWKNLSEQTGKLNIGLRNAFCRVNNEEDVENYLLQTWMECGFTEKPSISVNWVYLSENVDIGLVAFVIGLVFLIGFAGYLIIYNVFYISIMNDVQFYGRLKVIGLDNKQMRAILNKQAFQMFLTGMPIGMGVGYIFGLVLVPRILSLMGDCMQSTVVIVPSAFLLCIFFTGVTVWVSIQKPLHIMEKIDPIQSVNYTSVSVKKVETKKRFTIRKIAQRNIQRDKKKNSLVKTSITLVLMLFIFTVTLVKSIDFKNFKKMEIPCDIYVTSQAFMKDLEIVNLEENTVSDLETIISNGNISPYYYYNTIHFPSKSAELAINELCDEYASGKDMLMVTEHRYYLDQNTIQKFNVKEGEIDYNKWKSGEYVIVIADMGENYDGSAYHAGDKIELADYSQETTLLKNDNGEVEFIGLPKREYEVMAVVDYYYSLSIKSKPQKDVSTILPISELENHSGDVRLFAIGVDTNQLEDDTEKVDYYVKNVASKLSYKSALQVKAEYERFRIVIILLCTALTIVIGLLSIINLFNNEVTSIIERQKEFRTMWAIGITSKQNIAMLRYENLYIVSEAVLVGLVAGEIFAGVGLTKVSKSFAWISYQFTVFPIFGIILIYAIIIVLLPTILYGKLVVGKKYLES